MCPIAALQRGVTVVFFAAPLLLPQQRTDTHYVATAYSQWGTTASGQPTHRHVVAADPTLLPLGSRIKVSHAGRYSGEYVVADTGRKIEGRKLDIYIPNTRACRKFGKRRVKVRVLQVGDGTQATTKQADQQVKADVSKDVQKDVVGNAATEDDWAAKNRAAKGSGTTTGASPANPASPTNPPNPK